MIRTAFDSVARKRGVNSFEELPLEMQKCMIEGFRPLISELDSAGQPLSAYLSGMVHSVWDEIGGEITYEAVHQGHITSLERNVVPQKALEYMLSLNWSVANFEPGTLILGDIGALAYTPSSATLEPPLQPADRNATVLVPVSDQCLLIGASKVAPAPPLGPQVLNEGSASLSWSFILAARNTMKVQALSQLIGSRAESSWDEGVKAGETQIAHRVPPWRRGES